MPAQIDGLRLGNLVATAGKNELTRALENRCTGNYQGERCTKDSGHAGWCFYG